MKNGVILCTSVEYPTHELPEINFEGIEMEVSDTGEFWHKVKVFGKLNGRYLYEATELWNHARPIPQKVKVTKEQIAESFNTTVDNLEIVNREQKQRTTTNETSYEQRGFF